MALKDMSPLSTTPTSSDEPSDDAWTVARLLTWTADYLKRKGSESPRLDAEVMLARVLDWQRVQLYTNFAETVSEAPRAKFRELVRQRAEGAPVAYLVGRKEFYSLVFEVSPAVLIPRPESEFVVVELLARLQGVKAPRVVDVGTGSGCLAIASLHHLADATFVAIDISADALVVARRNAERLRVAERVDFRQGDLLEPLAGAEPFDAIVSNPPYIATDEIPRLERGVRDYEPLTALDGGADGLASVTRLIEQSVGLLKPGGHLILEIGSMQEEPVRALIGSHAQFNLAATIRDHSRHPRVILATRSA
jgi:release factor glutamine methyltransferase